MYGSHCFSTIQSGIWLTRASQQRVAGNIPHLRSKPGSQVSHLAWGSDDFLAVGVSQRGYLQAGQL
jgi:hypothetical protein